jgi:hypothetical protein
MKNTNIIIAASCFLVMQARAFAPSTCSSCSFREASVQRSSTELLGLRTFLRRKLSRSEKSSSPTTTGAELPSLHGLEDGDSLSNGDSIRVSKRTAAHNLSIPVPSMSNDAGSPAVIADQAVVESSASVMTLDHAIQNDQLDEPYALPPIGDRQLTKLETEFREMLLDFSQYTQRDILAVRNPRMRAIFQGVAASFALPAVYRAFEVLFEDYAPLRVAGRLIYGKLKSVMMEAQSHRQLQVDTVAEMTGLSKEEIELSRSAYFQLVVHEDDTATEMTLQQIVDYGLAEMAIEVLGYENFDDFVKSLNPCEKQKVEFEKLMVALQSCPVDNPSPECNPTLVLQEIAGKLDSRVMSGRNGNTDQKQQRLDERYNSMVERFRAWKSLVPNGDGRRLEILRGCFVGAESEEIVEALHVVYTDYSALRMSGDLIFKVMATLVGRKS